MMTQLPKLVVKKLVFEPTAGETMENYMNRCRSEIANTLGIPCTEGGYRDKVALAEIRKGKKDL